MAKEKQNKDNSSDRVWRKYAILNVHMPIPLRRQFDAVVSRKGMTLRGGATAAISDWVKKENQAGAQ